MSKPSSGNAKPAPEKAEKVESLQTGPRFEDQIAAAEQALAAAEKKAEDNWDKALRAIAELENTKRRAERDVEQAHKYALERFAQDLLPVIDSMEKALEVSSDDAQVGAIKQGVELTMKMFMDAVKKYGLEQLNPVGEPFDPNHHEAMTMQPNPDLPANTVMTVFQRGYLLNGRLIRPARVVVVQG